MGFYNLWEIVQRPEEVAAHGLVAILIGVFCLIAIWVGVTQRHWFVRTTIICGTLLIFIPIRAYQPLVLLASAMAFLIVGWSTARWRTERQRQVLSATKSERPRRLQFGLRDLLLMMALVGIVVWAANRIVADGIHIRGWWKVPLNAVLLAAVSSASVALLVSHRRRLLLVVLAATIVCAAAIEYWLIGDWAEPYWVFRTFSVLIVDYACLAAACLSMAWVGSAWWKPLHVSGVRFRRWIAVVNGIALIALCTWLYQRMLDVSFGPMQVSSGTNVYPRVLELGQALRNAGPAQAQAIRVELLELLQQPGFCILDWDAARHDPLGQNDVSRFIAPRQLCRDLTAECDRLQSVGKNEEAADYAVAILKLGQMAGRKGSLLDAQVGLAIEGVGEGELAELRCVLKDQKRRELIDILREIDSQREPRDTVVTRVDRWGLWTEGWRYRLACVQEELWSSQRPRMSGDYALHRGNREASQRMLSLDLALRTHHDEYGRWPLSLGLLIPEHLSESLVDPFSGRAFAYHLAESEVIIYSVGWDAHDDGGHFGNRTEYYNAQSARQPGLDFDLDTLTRP